MSETLLKWAQIATALGAILAVLVATWQACIARGALREQHESAREQQRIMHEDLKVSLLLRYEERWESASMMDLRRKLAGRLLDTKAYRQGHEMQDSIYEVTGDEIPGFFESLAIMHRRHHIDTEAAWAFFDHWALHYWAALQSFVRKDRAHNGENVWIEFEGFVKDLERYSAKHGDNQPIDDKAVEAFLQQERQVGN